MRDRSSPSGRGEYCLRRPNEFSPVVGHLQEQTEEMMSKQWGSGGQRLPDQKEIQNAASTLATLLPSQGRDTAERIVNFSPQPPVSHQASDEVLIDNQPYRTTPLVLPHAKTIHDLGDQGNKFVTPSRQPDSSCPPYRTSSLVMPGPRTIHEVKAGGPSFKPYRGPQYYADKGFSSLPLPTITQHSPDTNSLTHFQPLQTYNSPVNLYSDQALAEALHNKPVAVTTEGVAKPSARYQLPARTGAGAPNINQSSSFKKVMYSVMRDSEF